MPKGEFFKFAKMMGLDLSDSSLGPEAEEIWRKLNHMSENDPIAYSNFIAAQKEQAMEDTLAPSGKEEEQKFFRPTAGFSVECASTGGDGVKIRDVSGPASGKKVYINVCSHDVIEPAKNRNNAPIYDGFASIEGLEIPLYLGQVRNEEVSSIYLDAIFHPAVVAYCGTSGKSSNHFKRQIVDLAMEWTQKEKGIQLSSTWTISFYPYNGGLGDDRSVPVMCPVDKSGKIASTKNSTTAPSISPQSILKHVQASKNSDESLANTSLSFKTETKKNVGLSGSKVGIADLKSIVKGDTSIVKGDTGGDKEKKPAPKPSIKSDAAPVIKKGFLSDPKNAGALYPDGGSSEGKDGATGGSFARIMSKCQVVNVGADNSVTQVSNPPPVNNQKPQQQTAPKPKQPPKKDSQPTSRDLEAMDRLARQFDSDWDDSVKHEANAGDAFTDSLAEVAKMIGLPSDFSAADKAAKSAPVAAAAEQMGGGNSSVHNSLPGVTIESSMAADKDISVDEESIEGSPAVVINFRVAVNVDALAAMDLEVSDDAVVCSLGAQRIRLAGFPRPLARSRAKAALSRKKMAMKITVHYA